MVREMNLGRLAKSIDEYMAKLKNHGDFGGKIWRRKFQKIQEIYKILIFSSEWAINTNIVPKTVTRE